MRTVHSVTLLALSTKLGTKILLGRNFKYIQLTVEEFFPAKTILAEPPRRH